MQEILAEVARFLGEPVGSDPSGMFKMLDSFAKDFDASLIQVMKKVKYI